MFKRYTSDGIGHKDTRKDTRNLYKKLLEALGVSELNLPIMSSNPEEEFEADLSDALEKPPLEASDGEFSGSDIGEDNSDSEESETTDTSSREENDDDDPLSDGDYFELNEAEEDDKFDDEGLCSFFTL
ncbi:hypothetical protein ARMSODRAFT_977513 [Armillaria solidipes]|uniref:Uncharacterized protein n=1 Tax=Armillaria solidipes TaxID=1076256 RepID=A0A2H3BCH7_9AGAR|nr:hypothetical protein ARMSODRAFT_977513 [Armillaria solidipes]